MVSKHNKTAPFVFVSPSLIKQAVIILSPLSARVDFSFCSVIRQRGGSHMSWFLGYIYKISAAIKEKEGAASGRWKELIIVMKQRWPLTISWLLMYVFASCCAADPYFPPHLSVSLLWWRGTFQAGLKRTPFFFLFLMLKQKRLQLSNKACVTQRTAAACSG